MRSSFPSAKAASEGRSQGRPSITRCCQVRPASAGTDSARRCAATRALSAAPIFSGKGTGASAGAFGSRAPERAKAAARIAAAAG